MMKNILNCLHFLYQMISIISFKNVYHILILYLSVSHYFQNPSVWKDEWDGILVQNQDSSYFENIYKQRKLLKKKLHDKYIIDVRVLWIILTCSSICETQGKSFLILIKTKRNLWNLNICFTKFSKNEKFIWLEFGSKWFEITENTFIIKTIIFDFKILTWWSIKYHSE